jgi:hypothetical protein
VLVLWGPQIRQRSRFTSTDSMWHVPGNQFVHPVVRPATLSISLSDGCQRTWSTEVLDNWIDIQAPYAFT